MGHRVVVGHRAVDNNWVWWTGADVMGMPVACFRGCGGCGVPGTEGHVSQCGGGREWFSQGSCQEAIRHMGVASL